jgi:hypothetical protein
MLRSALRAVKPLRASAIAHRYCKMTTRVWVDLIYLAEPELLLQHAMFEMRGQV